MRCGGLFALLGLSPPPFFFTRGGTTGASSKAVGNPTPLLLSPPLPFFPQFPFSPLPSSSLFSPLSSHLNPDPLLHPSGSRRRRRSDMHKEQSRPGLACHKCRKHHSLSHSLPSPRSRATWAQLELVGLNSTCH